MNFQSILNTNSINQTPGRPPIKVMTLKTTYTCRKQNVNSIIINFLRDFLSTAAHLKHLKRCKLAITTITADNHLIDRLSRAQSQF